MLRTYFIISIISLLFACSLQEDSITQDQATGLYRRDRYDIEEFILLKKDFTYEYFTTKPSKMILTESNWDFRYVGEVSYVGISDFDYLISLKKHSKKYKGVAAPILYSHAKKAIVIRMSVDDHFLDFVKVAAN
jgi:hypothetical protein